MTCITNKHVIENTVYARSAILKFMFELCHTKKRPYILIIKEYLPSSLGQIQNAVRQSGNCSNSAYGIGSLHRTGNITAKRCSKVLQQHIRHIQITLFTWKALIIFKQANAKLHTACIITAMLHSRQVWVLNRPACSPDFSTTENKNLATKAQDCWSSIFYETRMGQQPSQKSRTGILPDVHGWTW